MPKGRFYLLTERFNAAVSIAIVQTRQVHEGECLAGGLDGMGEAVAVMEFSQISKR
ncbi:hypothetical protein HSBAA_14560 [Vreelandella sulfidaeris]|uniref:Uncharacterized protein n=1 Tax=Vreelandella sulfidaeris TaxID=115553 RepID=A0A455U2A9_9GAMM|nr:hypothetical protein HSBAA_14560 [Halomonas sulfidaeris]